MFIREQITEPSLKPCPFCGQSMIFISDVSYEKGDDEGYKIGCSCGWAGRLIRRWYSNKNKLISDWNSYIINDPEILTSE